MKVSAPADSSLPSTSWDQLMVDAEFELTGSLYPFFIGSLFLTSFWLFLSLHFVWFRVRVSLRMGLTVMVTMDVTLDVTVAVTVMVMVMVMIMVMVMVMVMVLVMVTVTVTPLRDGYVDDNDDDDGYGMVTVTVKMTGRGVG
jgi:hypothetical protein